MMEEKIQKLKSIYGICLSVLTFVVGALFILQTWGIFFSKESSPYTTAIIFEKFSQILAPICLWVLAVIGSSVLYAYFPEEEKRIKGTVDCKATLCRLKGGLPQNDGGMYALNKESAFRKILWITCGILCFSIGVVVIFILLNDAYQPLFSAEIFTEHNAAADRLVSVIPWLAMGMLVCFIATMLEARSIQREIMLVKTKIVENLKQGIKPIKSNAKPRSLFEKLADKIPLIKSNKFKLCMQAGLYVLGITLFIIGIANGGMTDVFEKARNICTQCIGLG